MKSDTQKKKPSGCLKAIVVVFVVILGILAADKFLPSRARRALPRSATQVQEFYHDHGITGDFIRVLKARLPESDFPRYAEKLGLSIKYDPSIHNGKYDRVKHGGGRGPEWFDPPDNADNCYFDYTPEDDYIQWVKWQDGWVYFLALSS